MERAIPVNQPALNPVVVIPKWRLFKSAMYTVAIAAVLIGVIAMFQFPDTTTVNVGMTYLTVVNDTTANRLKVDCDMWNPMVQFTIPGDGFAKYKDREDIKELPMTTTVVCYDFPETDPHAIERKLTSMEMTHVFGANKVERRYLGDYEPRLFIFFLAKDRVWDAYDESSNVLSWAETPSSPRPWRRLPHRMSERSMFMEDDLFEEIMYRRKEMIKNNNEYAAARKYVAAAGRFGARIIISGITALFMYMKFGMKLWPLSLLVSIYLPSMNPAAVVLFAYATMPLKVSFPFLYLLFSSYSSGTNGGVPYPFTYVPTAWIVMDNIWVVVAFAFAVFSYQRRDAKFHDDSETSLQSGKFSRNVYIRELDEKWIPVTYLLNVLCSNNLMPYILPNHQHVVGTNPIVSHYAQQVNRRPGNGQPLPGFSRGRNVFGGRNNNSGSSGSDGSGPESARPTAAYGLGYLPGNLQARQPMHRMEDDSGSVSDGSHSSRSSGVSSVVFTEDEEDFSGYASEGAHVRRSVQFKNGPATIITSDVVVQERNITVRGLGYLKEGESIPVDLVPLLKSRQYLRKGTSVAVRVTENGPAWLITSDGPVQQPYFDLVVEAEMLCYGEPPAHDAYDECVRLVNGKDYESSVQPPLSRFQKKVHQRIVTEAAELRNAPSDDALDFVRVSPSHKVVAYVRQLVGLSAEEQSSSGEVHNEYFCRARDIISVYFFRPEAKGKSNTMRGRKFSVKPGKSAAHPAKDKKKWADEYKGLNDIDDDDYDRLSQLVEDDQDYATYDDEFDEWIVDEYDDYLDDVQERMEEDLDRRHGRRQYETSRQKKPSTIDELVADVDAYNAREEEAADESQFEAKKDTSIKLSLAERITAAAKEAKARGISVPRLSRPPNMSDIEFKRVVYAKYSQALAVPEAYHTTPGEIKKKKATFDKKTSKNVAQKNLVLTEEESSQFLSNQKHEGAILGRPKSREICTGLFMLDKSWVAGETVKDKIVGCAELVSTKIVSAHHVHTRSEIEVNGKHGVRLVKVTKEGSSVKYGEPFVALTAGVLPKIDRSYYHVPKDTSKMQGIAAKKPVVLVDGDVKDVHVFGFDSVESKFDDAPGEAKVVGGNYKLFASTQKGFSGAGLVDKKLTYGVHSSGGNTHNVFQPFYQQEIKFLTDANCEALPQLE